MNETLADAAEKRGDIKAAAGHLGLQALRLPRVLQPVQVLFILRETKC